MTASRPSSLVVTRRLLLGRPEEFGDGVDLTEEPIGDRNVIGLLGVTGGLRRHPKQIVEVRELLQVLDLEVVGPEDPEVVLDQVATLFFDDRGADLEVSITRRVVLLHASLYRLRFDPRLRGVVHATRQVTVRRRDERSRRGIQ